MVQIKLFVVFILALAGRSLSFEGPLPKEPPKSTAIRLAETKSKVEDWSKDVELAGSAANPASDGHISRFSTPNSYSSTSRSSASSDSSEWSRGWDTGIVTKKDPEHTTSFKKNLPETIKYLKTKDSIAERDKRAAEYGKRKDAPANNGEGSSSKPQPKRRSTTNN